MRALPTFVRELAEDRRGNIAMMFGLLMFVILGAAGIAIDLQRSNLMRTEVNESSDAALLAAARYKAGHPNANAEELTQVARRVFDDGNNASLAIEINRFEVSFDSAAAVFALDVQGQMKTLIMGVFGHKFVEINTRSEAKLGKPPLIEVAMALDTTGSMGSNGKISALKNAAKDLVKTLFEADGADVKIGVVPFAQYVNVGTKYKTAKWISMPAGVWLGCVGSRDYPLNVQDDDYIANPAKGVATGKTMVECPKELLPLSTDETEINKVINGLSAKGTTYVPSGLLWAWSLLTPTVPFTEGIPFEDLETKNGTKALIVMTDGENTRAPTYPLHDSADQTLADKLTSEICVNIKKQKIVVYSIAFSVTEPNIKKVLEDCATNSSYYFDAKDSAELSEAFASIANSLRSISLSK